MSIPMGMTGGFEEAMLDAAVFLAVSVGLCGLTMVVEQLREARRNSQMAADVAAILQSLKFESRVGVTFLQDGINQGRLCGTGVSGLMHEEGTAMLEVALILPLLVVMLVGAVDFGRGYYMSIEVAAAAEAGALYGTINPTSASGMQSAALMDAQDVPVMTASASYGCECSDGSSAVSQCSSAPSGCAANTVNYVEVNTVANYVPFLPYPGVPSTLVLKGRSRLRASY